MKKQIGYIFSSLVILVLLIDQSYAYVDPGSGSAIVTTVLGLLAAVGYTCRKYFYKLRGKIKKRKTTENENDDKNKE